MGVRWTEEQLTAYLRRGQAAPMSEAQLLAIVRAALKRINYLTYHTHMSKRSEPGFPDLVAVPDPLVHRRDVTMYMLELKREDERPTLAQQHWLDALARVEQVEAHLLRPSGLEGFLARLRA